MILTSFFILSIIIFSSIGIVYAENFIATTTVTVELILPVCEEPQKLDLETFECKTSQGGSGSEPTSPSYSNSGGCGITGVGPDGSHGHGGTYGAIGRDCGLIGVGPGDLRPRTQSHQPSISSDISPKWISNVVLLWIDDKITQEEFKNVITYLLDENIMPNDIPKPDISLGEFDPTTKRIFELWVNGNLQDFHILKIIQDYRQLGIW